MARKANEPRLAAKQEDSSSLVSSLKSGLRSYGGIAVVCAFIVMGLLFAILSQVTARTTYYVLNDDVPARTKVTADMLKPVDVSRDGAPKGFLTPAQVAGGDMYTRVALTKGEIITPSNTGPLQRITANVPDDFVAASFKVSADNAVGGKVRAGDYIDIIATDPNGKNGPVTKVVLHHVLVLDATVSPSSISKSSTDGKVGDKSKTDPNGKNMRNGIPQVYTVGLTPKDATVLAAVRDNNLMVTLASNAVGDKLDASTAVNDVFSNGGVGDSGAGTQAQTNDKGAQQANPGQPGTTPTQK